jgi:hypothetical protein
VVVVVVVPAAKTGWMFAGKDGDGDGEGEGEGEVEWKRETILWVICICDR